MDKYKNILPAILMILPFTFYFGQVGIGTSTPDSNALLELFSTNKGFLLPQLELQAKNLPAPMTVHRAGVLVYNSSTSGTADNAVQPGLYYNDGSSWVPMAAESKKIGDVKYGFQSSDHNGWYLLDGRSINSLSSVAKNSAITLGYASSLPDNQNRFLKTKLSSENTGATGGGAVALSRANLPNINFTGTTNSMGAHTHTYTDNSSATAASASGSNNPISNSGNGNYNTNSAGDHSHTLSVSSGGSNSPINYAPPYVTANMFIYLGI